MPASAPTPHASAPTLASRPLPERVRGLLGGILEYASEELERTLVAVLNEFEQQVFKFAEQARSNVAQTRWLEAQRLVKRTRPDLVPRFLIALEAELACIRDAPGTKALAGGYRLGSGEMTLVENLDLDEATVLQEIAGRAEVRSSLPLYLLGQRFGVLAGRPAFDSENLPIGPQALCRIMRQASDCLELGGEHRQLLFRTFERHLMPLYSSFIESVNTYLARNGVLPNLHYVPVRVRPGSPEPVVDRNKPRSFEGDTRARQRGGTDAASGLGLGLGSVDSPRRVAPSATPPTTESAKAGDVAESEAGSAAAADAGGAPGQGPAARGSGLSPEAVAAARAMLQTQADPVRDAANDAFQQMRQLLAGRKQLLGKLGGAGARPSGPVAGMVVETSHIQDVLGHLQHSGKATVLVSGKPTPRTVTHLKQDLLAQLRQATPDGRAPLLSDEDGDTIDLVGMLFDHVMKDVKPSSPAAMLLAKLQVPLLRVALQDKAFFTRQQHPARQMLNTIAETGVYWLGEDDTDQALVGKMQSAVDRTVRDFDGDLGLFNNLLVDLSAHMQTVSRKAEVAEKRHVEAARGKEKLALAREQAADVVEALLRKHKMPRFTHTLLSQAWTDVMALTSLRHGDDSDQWRQQLDIAERLVATSRTPAGTTTLPEEDAQALRQEIVASLTQVGYQEDEASAIAQRLVDPGTTTGEEDGAASRTELTMRMKARARLGEELQQVKRRKVPLSPDEQARLDHIKSLPFGTWFEFTVNQQGDTVRR